MPGTRLSKNEKKLLDRWHNPTVNSNFLRSITIDTDDDTKAGVGLRGIVKAQMDFNYPVTVLVGPNGSGKSTFLNLAALAFRGKTLTPSGRASPGYRFPDFFFSVAKEVQPTNFTITWNIHHGKTGVRTTKMVRRSTRKWMDYERRHPADVIHIGLSRIASLSESGSHKRAFGTAKEKPISHDSWITNAMSSIFSRKYNESVSIPAGKYAVPQVGVPSGNHYSAFNMGTGEAAVISILEDIAKCPRGALILIEEIEMAIHPSAQAKLAQVLVDRALDQDLQVICTSHSRWFVDALPREARILVQPSGDKHVCISNITTRLAEGALLGKHQEELLVICEDPVGQMIVESALPMEIRSRVKIVPCGSKSELGRAATYTHLTNPTLPILIVWDGDATDTEIRAAFDSADGGKHLSASALIEWTRIGGPEIMQSAHVHVKTDAPEHQIKRTLLEDEQSQKEIAAAFDTETFRVKQMLESAAVEEGSHHRLFDDIQSQTGTTLDFVGRTLSRAYVDSLRASSGAELPLVSAIERMLAGDRRGFFRPWLQDLKTEAA